jgi:hypothetical protein
MKKRLRFLYRYFTTTRRWRRWINIHTGLALVILVLFLGILAWTAPLSAAALQVEPPRSARQQLSIVSAVEEVGEKAQADAPAPSLAPSPSPLHTPLPPEYYHTEEQSIGISIGAVVLVVVVVAGLLMFLPRKDT